MPQTLTLLVTSAKIKSAYCCPEVILFRPKVFWCLSPQQVAGPVMKQD